MFWIIAFIVVIGLIIEGGKPSARHQQSRKGSAAHTSPTMRREHIANRSIERETRAEQRKNLPEAKQESENIDRLLAELDELDVEPSVPGKHITSKGVSDSARQISARSTGNAATVVETSANVTAGPFSFFSQEFGRWGITSLWHMTHIENVPSIIQNGLLSHQSPKLAALNAIDISDPEVQRWRNKADPLFGLSLHDYVPLYLNPRNPMLYRRKEMQREICFIEVSPEALEGKRFLISDGNAASGRTKFFKSASDLQFLPWEVLRSSYWNDFDDGKRKACSEVLVPYSIAPPFIRTVHCFSSAETEVLARKGIKSVISMDKYFR